MLNWRKTANIQEAESGWKFWDLKKEITEEDQIIAISAILEVESHVQNSLLLQVEANSQRLLWLIFSMNISEYLYYEQRHKTNSDT